MRKYLPMLLACAACMTGALEAATLTYNTVPHTGDSLAVKLILNDSAVANAIQGTLSVDNSSNANIGDLRGLFFDLINLPSGLTPANVRSAISGAHITSSGTNTASQGQGNNVNPLGPFSIALEFGSPGIGGDDIRSTTFLINNALLASPLTLNNFGSVAVRATSVGIGANRGGSSKLIDREGTYTPAAVPEPSAYLLMGSGLGGVLAFARRRK